MIADIESFNSNRHCRHGQKYSAKSFGAKIGENTSKLLGSESRLKWAGQNWKYLSNFRFILNWDIKKLKTSFCKQLRLAVPSFWHHTGTINGSKILSDSKCGLSSIFVIIGPSSEIKNSETTRYKTNRFLFRVAQHNLEEIGRKVEIIIAKYQITTRRLVNLWQFGWQLKDVKNIFSGEWEESLKVPFNRELKELEGRDPLLPGYSADKNRNSGEIRKCS